MGQEFEQGPAGMTYICFTVSEVSEDSMTED